MSSVPSSGVGSRQPPSARPTAAGAVGPADPALTARAWRDLVQAARAPYRNCGLFAWFFARGKLAWDPVFRSLLEMGAIAPRARIVDIGCGQGLLASLLAAVDAACAADRWPATWPPAPVGASYTGIELMPRDVRRATAALAGLPAAPSFVLADMVDVQLPACDVVVILDVLHYVDHAAQVQVLARAFAALAAGGRLLLRIGDSGAPSGFRASQWTDRIITCLRGHRVAPTFCRSLDAWTALLREVGFAEVRSLPMSSGTPFANVLLVADKG